MKMYGLTLVDGKAVFASRLADGLHLSFINLDQRNQGSFGSGTQDEFGALELMVVIPTPISLPTGEVQFQFSAIGFDVFGNQISVSPDWSIVESGTYATIDSETGILTTGVATEEEDITVRATSGSITADAEVSISDLVLDSIAIAPSSWTMSVGQTRAFSAIGYVGSAPVVITPTWSVQSGVGTIDASTGLYTAGTVSGSAVIRATFGSTFAEANITVNPGAISTLYIEGDENAVAGALFQTFTLVAEDSYGNLVPISSGVTWVMENPSAGTITIVPVGAVCSITRAANPTEFPAFYPDALSAEYGDTKEFTGILAAPDSEGGGGGPEE